MTNYLKYIVYKQRTGFYTHRVIITVQNYVEGIKDGNLHKNIQIDHFE